MTKSTSKMDMSKFTTPQTKMGEGSEGGHWYSPGPPVECCYQIQSQNGNWRAPTIRDARKFNWYPGVTTIIRQAAAPGLERWKVRQGILSALTHPKLHEITDADQLIRVIEADSMEQAKQARDKGTLIHGAIEGFYRDGIVDTDYAPYVSGVRAVLHQLTGVDDPSLWETEVAACHPFGVGTRIDLLSRELEMVVDFKGKEFGPGEIVKAYREQGQQLAVNKEMLGHPKWRAVNLFVSRNHPGLVFPYEWDQSDHEGLWQSFCYLLAFWQTVNNMPMRVDFQRAA